MVIAMLCSKTRNSLHGLIYHLILSILLFVSAVTNFVLISVPTVEPSTTVVASDFTEGPSYLNITIGETAVFNCQYPYALTVDWRLNGTLLEASNFPLNVSISSRSLPDDSEFQHTLIITALLEFNNTILTVCYRIYKQVLLQYY